MQLSPNQIVEERERVQNRRYEKFLIRLRLQYVRGFRDKEVEFKFPVTALIGTNGGGKSTILGAAALSYKDMPPRQFFPKATIGDATMADWRFEAEFIDRNVNRNGSFTRTARFAQAKWRRDDFPERTVEYIEIQRTVPASEISKFKRFLREDQGQIQLSPLSEATINYATAILDRNVNDYRLARIQGVSDATMYVRENNELGYSQFHFGAGEASVISTVDRIENAPNQSLILIEELENGLHPVALRQLVRYLMNAARRKRLQVIFTTHSQQAIDELPAEAIWACINESTFNGRLSVESLRAVTGSAPNHVIVFVEDDFVMEWAQDAISQHAEQLIHTTKIFPAGGFPNVLNVAKYHNSNPAVSIPAACLVDGDVEINDVGGLPEFVRLLGNGTPETIVFDYIYENRTLHSGLIQQRCLLPNFLQANIIREIEAVYRGGHDPHELFRILGERLNFQSEIVIRKGLISIFNQHNQNFWEPAIDLIQRLAGDMERARN